MATPHFRVHHFTHLHARARRAPPAGRGRGDGSDRAASYGVDFNNRPLATARTLTPGCSLSGRSAGILYPLAGRRRICRSGRHDGDGATKSYGVSKATSRENRRLDSTTPGCSLSGRSAGILYPLAGRRRICRSGRHDGDGATKSYGVSKATSRENRRLDSTTPGCSLSGRSAGILYPLAGRRRICRSGRHDGDGATK